MREVPALMGRHLRTALRSRGALLLAVVGLLALVAVSTLATGGGGARSTVVLGGLVVVGTLAFGVAASTGSLLPADRAEGREAWLATLAPGGGSRRAAAALAGMTLTLFVALAGAAILALVLPFVLPDAGVRASLDLAAPVGERLRAIDRMGHALRLPVGEAGVPGRTLEVVFQPRYQDWSAVGQPLAVAWRAEAGDAPVDQGTQILAYGSPFRLDLRAEADAVVLTNPGRNVDLFVREVHVLGAERSLLWSLLLAGLVLGVAAAAVAPLAVLISRWTSAPTATTAGLVVVLAGGLRLVLPDLTPPDRGWTQDLGLGIVDTAARLAPDLEPLALLAVPGAGRALEVSHLVPLGPLVAYALVALVLVVLPLPSEPARGRTS